MTIEAISSKVCAAKDCLIWMQMNAAADKEQWSLSYLETV